MKLSDFFSLLTATELKNLKVGGKDEGGIYPKYSDEVMVYITLGLTDLHTRFELKRGELILKQFDGIQSYKLSEEFAESNTGSTEPFKWIVDSVDRPFVEDILTIQEVFDAEGCELPINKFNVDNHVETTRYNVVKFNETAEADAEFVINYKANHDPIDISVTQPKNVELDIPDSLIRPLSLYVASLAHSSVNSPEGVQAGLNKMSEYNNACVEAELRGFVRKDDSLNTIVDTGWV